MNQEKFDRLKKQAQTFRLDTFHDRIGRLKKIKKWIQSHETEIIEALHKDFRKPQFETEISEIIPVLSEINFVSDHLKKWMKDVSVSTPFSLLGHSSSIRYENKGVILVIAPWNYPFQLALAPLISAIAAGNTVVVKPSELTPATADVIRKLVEDCFPPNEVTVVLGGKEKVDELLTYNFDHVFFTGSTQVGRIIAQKCAALLTPYTLELGGKSPTIIDDGVNIDEVAQKIHWGKFLNRGQTCIAPDYLIVHKNIKADLIQRLEFLAREASDYEKASIISVNHLNRLNRLTGKTDAQLKDVTLQIVDQPALNSPVMQEEIFGPVLPVLSFTNLDDVIQLLKQNENPLALYIFSKSKDFQDYIIKRIPSGGVGINSILLQFGNHHLPFGGVRGSGQGRYHGHHGFLELSHHRAVIKQNYFKKLTENFYPPYSPKKMKLISLFKKYFV